MMFGRAISLIFSVMIAFVFGQVQVPTNCTAEGPPFLISQTATQNFEDLNGFALRIFLPSNPTLIAVASRDAGFRVGNLTNPVTLSLLTLFLDGSDVRSGACFSDDNTCLIAGRSDNPGIRFTRIFGPNQTSEPNFAFIPFADPENVVISPNEQWAYVADSGSGLSVINLENISVPIHVVQADRTLSETTNLLLREDTTPPYVIVARGIQFNGGVTIFDVTDPTNPVEIANLDLPISVIALSMVGPLLYVGGASAIASIDLTDPSNPVLLDMMPTESIVTSVTIAAGNTRLVVADENFIDVYDITDPSNLVELPPLETPFVISDLTLDPTEQFMYIAAGPDATVIYCTGDLLTRTAPADSNQTPVIVGAVVGSVFGCCCCILVGAILIGGVLWLQKRREKSHEMVLAMDQPMEDQPRQNPEKKKKMRSVTHQIKKLNNWKIDFSELDLDRKLGEGQFGEVWHGTWRNSEIAAKKLKTAALDQDVIMEFCVEANNLRKLRPHPNVVLMFGVCVDMKQPLCMIFEYLPLGSLDILIRRNQIDLTASLAFALAADAASGMNHLHTENFLHCDLASRNLLCVKTQSRIVAKISDFGLSKLLEDEGRQSSVQVDQVAVRWAAPEVLNHGTYTKASDVWAYGIVLWEIWQKGERPYGDVCQSDVVDRVITRKLLSKPNKVAYADKIYPIMELCWAEKPEDRPSFMDLLTSLENIQKEERLSVKDNVPKRISYKWNDADTFTVEYDSEGPNEYAFTGAEVYAHTPSNLSPNTSETTQIKQKN